MRDAQGIEIRIGDPVHVKIGTEWIQGHVVKMQQGGLSLATGLPNDKNPMAGEMPDAIVFQVGVAFQMMGLRPGMPIPAMVKLAGPNIVDAQIESSIKM